MAQCREVLPTRSTQGWSLQKVLLFVGCHVSGMSNVVTSRQTTTFSENSRCLSCCCRHPLLKILRYFGRGLYQARLLFFIALLTVPRHVAAMSCSPGATVGQQNTCVAVAVGKWYLKVLFAWYDFPFQGNYATSSTASACPSAVRTGAAICQSTQGRVQICHAIPGKRFMGAYLS
jgi:hypothetical protein